MVFQVHFSISCQVTHPIPYRPRDPFGHNWHLFLEGCEQPFRCEDASSHSAENRLHERGPQKVESRNGELYSLVMYQGSDSPENGETVLI